MADQKIKAEVKKSEPEVPEGVIMKTLFLLVALSSPTLAATTTHFGDWFVTVNGNSRIASTVPENTSSRTFSYGINDIGQTFFMYSNPTPCRQWDNVTIKIFTGTKSQSAETGSSATCDGKSHWLFTTA
ncbi:hypothetical protein D5018_00540 [Parashewanella curva]|uniref:Uncharacterized protein n=1 Tax=Parashewanella curva TaxID=2338552 RepID=A0A3L8Q1X6_9GAMM|nr:hypothetical protein [Parashewanella curva]RLV61641.1 hypothetical protein D5018_00540 [Parashewanella curva]